MTTRDDFEWSALEQLLGRDVSRETFERLKRYQAEVCGEAGRQNLVSAATLPNFWERHVLDSAQLLSLPEANNPTGGTWVDLGSGAGLPGMVLALLGVKKICLIEERKLRAAFLRRMMEDFALTDAQLIAQRVERAPPMAAAVISARAFAPLDRLFSLAHRFSRKDTVWVLPRGRNATEELALLHHTWQGDFKLVPSKTDHESAILIARQVHPSTRREHRE